jgi:hypothetical protein
MDYFQSRVFRIGLGHLYMAAFGCYADKRHLLQSNSEKLLVNEDKN